MPLPTRSSEWNREVGLRLASTRNALGLTQEQLGNEINVSRTALGNWEKGIRLPDPAAIMRLAERFGIPMDWVYRGDPGGLPQRYAPALLGKISWSSEEETSEKKVRSSR